MMKKLFFTALFALVASFPEPLTTTWKSIKVSVRNATFRKRVCH